MYSLQLPLFFPPYHYGPGTRQLQPPLWVHSPQGLQGVLKQSSISTEPAFRSAAQSSAGSGHTKPLTKRPSSLTSRPGHRFPGPLPCAQQFPSPQRSEISDGVSQQTAPSPCFTALLLSQYCLQSFPVPLHSKATPAFKHQAT